MLALLFFSLVLPCDYHGLMSWVKKQQVHYIKISKEKFNRSPVLYRAIMLKNGERIRGKQCPSFTLSLALFQTNYTVAQE